MTDPISYRDAVQFSADYLDNLGVRTAGPDMLRQLRFVFAYRTGMAGLDREGNRAPDVDGMEHLSREELLELIEAPVSADEEARYRLVLTGENTEAIEKLIEMTEVSSIAFSALSDVAASMARNGLPYTGKLRDWVADVLEGKIKNQRRPGRLKAETLGRDLYIVGAIFELMERGMTATRNDVSEPTSACDVVADALKELGVSPRSYSSVKRIWLNADRVLRFC